MATLYRIRDWDDLFETAQSRRIKGQLPWVAIPTKHDGLGYKRLMRAGADLFAAWILIVQVAAKCRVRGILQDENGPLGPDELEEKTHCPAELFERALNALCSNKIGWITRTEIGECSEHAPDTEQTGQDKQTYTTGQISEHREVLPDGESHAAIPPAAADSDLLSSRLADAGPIASELFRKTGYNGSDGGLLWQSALLVRLGEIPESWVFDAAEGVRLKGPQNPVAYFREVLSEHCRSNGRELGPLLRSVRLPRRFSTGPPSNAKPPDVRSLATSFIRKP